MSRIVERRLALLNALCFLFLLGMAQTQTITTGRGETFEIIAKRYGMTLDELRQMNPNATDGIVGIELVVKKVSSSQPATNINASHSIKKAEESVENYAGLYGEAENLIGNAKYSKAIKKLNRLIKLSPKGDYFLQRGYCYYMENKYKSAIKDYEEALYSPTLSDRYKTDCKNMLNTVKRKRQDQLRRRSQVWGNIGAALAVTAAVGATAYAVSEQSKDNQRTYTNYGSLSYVPSPYTTSGDGSANVAQFNARSNQMMADLNKKVYQMGQDAARQTNMAMQRSQRAGQEQLAWAIEFKNKYGREPTEAELDNWLCQHYPDIWQLKIQDNANKSEFNPTTNSIDQRNEERDKKLEGIRQKNKEYWEDKSTPKECQQCRGSGICQTCNGDGWVNRLGTKSGFCPVCFNHDGKCRWCLGEGKRINY